MKRSTAQSWPALGRPRIDAGRNSSFYVGVHALTATSLHPSEARPIFSWRARGYPSSHTYGGPPSGFASNRGEWREAGYACAYCGYPLWTTHDVFGWWIPAKWYGCNVCGCLEINAFDNDHRLIWSAWSVLKKFDLDNHALRIAEVASYLVGHRERIARISPRRAEELVDFLLQEQGYTTELTRKTRDGGRDVIIVSHSGDTLGIVEVKHSRGTVGVKPVRELRGVQLRDGVPSAILACTTTFSPEGRSEAAASIPQAIGFEFSLIDVHDLLLLLDLYVTPRVSITSQLANADERSSSRSSGFLPWFVPGGQTIRSQHRYGAVIGHTPAGKRGVAILGQEHDGVKQLIDQNSVSRSVNLAADLVIGSPKEISVAFNIEEWPVLGWNEIATDD